MMTVIIIVCDARATTLNGYAATLPDHDKKKKKPFLEQEQYLRNCYPLPTLTRILKPATPSVHGHLSSNGPTPFSSKRAHN